MNARGAWQEAGDESQGFRPERKEGSVIDVANQTSPLGKFL